MEIVFNNPQLPYRTIIETRFITHCNIAKLRPAQTLALAGPEARHYNHPATARRPAANVCISYISAISQRIELKFCMIDI